MGVIGIIGAMNIEIEGLLTRMDEASVKAAAGIDFHVGKLGGRDVVVARCGIGKVNAAMCAQAMLGLFSVDAVINLGVAGAVFDGLDVKDVVVSEYVLQHDFDIVGRAAGFVPDLGVEIAADEGLVKAALAACDKVFAENPGQNRAFKGPVATGDQFVAGGGIKTRIWDVFGAYCVEMEGAAIGQVCFLNKVPFVVIRAISDKADGSAEVDFGEFVAAAAANSAEIVLEMMGWI